MISSDLIDPDCVFPATDSSLARAWATAIHAVARSWNARVAGEVEPVTVGQSFYRVVLESTEGAATTLMMNPSGRLVAAVSGDRPFAANTGFVAVPHPNIFVSAGFAVADVDVLAAELSQRDLVHLSDHDAAQVRYHNPGRVGDVIFNWFD